MKTIKIFTLLFAIAFIGQSCRKESDEIIITPPYTEPKISITGSVLGTVIDENGNAIEDAMVSFENNSVFTDEFGVFQFKNESLYSTGTYIKVSKDGFFDGSRRFYPSSGKTSMVDIELISKTKVGEFNSTNGSKIIFEDVELDFPANSIMNEDGSTYSGNVNVAAKYLDPTLTRTFRQMPGDLTGTTTEQNRVALTSMAMITVELLDDNGNKLQVREGKTVDAKIPVPQSLQSTAPNTIPMWYFDEEAGTWVEEGSAVLVNGVYETSLAHFSFWNCDVPNDYIFLKGSILNRNIPVQGATVVVTVAGSGASGSAVTGPDGFFCGFVPNGVDLVLEIYDPCGNVIYTQTIPASEIDIFLDPISLSLELDVATISGTVALCEGTPSSQTYVVASQGTLDNIIPINDDLTFSGNIFYCDNSDISVGAIDPINALASGTSSYSLSGNLDVGEILMCDEQITPILILQFGDISQNINFYNADSIINELDSTLIAYNVQVIVPDVQEMYDVRTWNIITGVINLLQLSFFEGQPLQDASIELEEYGFNANGEAMTKKVTQGGITYLISTGTLTDIDVTDPAVYDSSYDELFFYIAFEIN